MDRFDDETLDGETGQSSSFDSLRDPLGIVRRRWRPMLIVVLAGLAATPLAVWLLPPIYEARASVLIATQKLSESFVRSTFQEDATERINALTSEVLSRQSLSEVVEHFDLYPELREQEGMGEAVAMLAKNVSIELDPGIRRDPSERARVVLVFFSDGKAERAADVTNDLANRLTVAGMRLRSEQARVTTQFLRRELESAEVALREQSKKVSEFQEAHRGELPSELESHLRRLERLQQQRNSLALQIAEGETRIATLRVGEEAPDSPQSQLVDLKAQLARSLSVNKESHPNVISLRRQIALLEKEFGDAPDRSGGRHVISNAAQRELVQIRMQLAETDRELVDLDAKVARIPARQLEMDALVQRETVLRENYLDFMRKVKDAELAQSLELAQQGGRVSILDPASPPTEPKRPRWQIALGGVAAAIGLALALGLLLEWRDPLIMTEAALKALAGVPVLGSLPHIATDS
jgi:polysaccharide biosynthesis transport protein